MAIKNFSNGSVLYTGDDLMESLLSSLNHRNNYDRKSCFFCAFQDIEDAEECDDCSGNGGCSRHINPPCSFCVDNHFEVSPFLLNYKRYKDNGKWLWECIKSNENTFNKLTEIEKKGFEVSSEILSTGEIAIYASHIDEDLDIEISDNRKGFKLSLEKLINRFVIDEKK